MNWKQLVQILFDGEMFVEEAAEKIYTLCTLDLPTLIQLKNYWNWKPLHFYDQLKTKLNIFAYKLFF